MSTFCRRTDGTTPTSAYGRRVISAIPRALADRGVALAIVAIYGAGILLLIGAWR